MDYYKFLGMPEDWSANGAEIDSIIFWMHVLMAALLVGWGLFFLFTLVRFRRGASPKANYHGVTSHANSYLEVAVAIVEVIFLVGLSIPLWAKRIEYPEGGDKPERVNVIAQQFAWHFHYPGPDGKWGPRANRYIDPVINPIGLDEAHPDAQDDVTSYQHLHLPVDRPVVLQLTSKDVIHSFSIPVMRVKTDIIPGMHSSLWFKPMKIACSKFY